MSELVANIKRNAPELERLNDRSNALRHSRCYLDGDSLVSGKIVVEGLGQLPAEEMKPTGRSVSGEFQKQIVLVARLLQPISTRPNLSPKYRAIYPTERENGEVF